MIKQHPIFGCRPFTYPVCRPCQHADRSYRTNTVSFTYPTCRPAQQPTGSKPVKQTESNSFFIFLFFLFLLSLPVSAQIQRLEYFIDTDPGVGLATEVAGFTKNNNVTVPVGSVSSAALSEGLHRIYVRAQDMDSRWSLTQFRTFYHVKLRALSEIRQIEYFVDADPGLGNGVQVDVSGTDVVQSINVALDQSQDGIHTLYVRSKNVDGRWSMAQSRSFQQFYVENLPMLNGLEWFIDSDPGFGKGNKLSLSGTASGSMFAIDITGAAPGMHTLYVRGRNTSMQWGLTNSITFVKADITAQADITQLEYFIDTDPGTGKAAQIIVTRGKSVTAHFPVNPDAFSEGIHTLYVRAMNEHGRWSIVQNIHFYKTASQDISQTDYLEYFIDADPGFGKGNPVSITPSDHIIRPFTVDMSAVDHGVHRLYIRARNTGGRWSITQSGIFIKTAVPETVPVTALEWFIDNDPGAGQAHAVPVSATETVKVFSADFGNFPAGLHALYVRARNAAGHWSITQHATVFRATSPDVPDIVRMEYYIGKPGDPAPQFGQAAGIPFVQGQRVSATFQVSLPAGMDEGWYTFNVRAMDSKGQWSITQQQGFILSAQAKDANAVALEYFADRDPGFGKGRRIALTSANSQTIVPISEEYTEGLHTLYIRAQNARGEWGLAQSIQILTASAPDIAGVTGLEWFIDNDPGLREANQVAVTQPAQLVQRTFNVPVSTLDAGVHTFYVRAVNASGGWSITNRQTFILTRMPDGYKPAALSALEWFIDNDPGFGNGTTVSIAETSADSRFAVAFDSNTSPGFHQLYIRAQNRQGRWSVTHSIPLLVAEIPSDYRISAVTAVEWFIDSDPGIRAAARVPVNKGQSVQHTFTVSVASLDPGMHTFYVRAVNEAGAWSITHRQTFIKTDTPDNYELPAMSRLEYFVDDDPGFGRAVQVDLLPQTSAATAFNINLENLEDGPHTLYVRAIDKTGRWTHTQSIAFYRTNEKVNWKKETVYLEYFIDTDPGFGKGLSVPVPASDNVDKSVFIPLSDIWPGMHEIYFRARDVRGFWSHAKSISLMVIDNPNLGGLPDITALEYFIDKDPGFGKGAVMAINRNTGINERFFIEIDTIPAGLHDLYVRARNSRGEWGHTQSICIYNTGIPQFPEMANIVAFEYFVDNDPGAGKANRIASLSQDQRVQQQISVNVDTLKTGIHAIFVRAQDSKGQWSHTHRFNFVRAALPANAPVAAIEWFIDDDPGIGKGKAVHLVAGNAVDHKLNITLPDDISAGAHSLCIRAKSGSDEWSIVHSIDFVAVRILPLAGIAALEYFIDTDPGFGAGIAMPVPYGSPDAQVPAIIPLAGIEPGLHSFHVRAKNMNEAWSITQYQPFVVTRIRGDVKIMELEYFVDTDPGFGKGRKVAGVAPGTDIDRNFTVNLNGCDPGLHSLYIRARDENNGWSITQDITFFNFEQTATSDVVMVEYFIDEDPGFGKASRKTVAAAASATVNVPIDLDMVASGIHTLYFRAKNSLGKWGTTHDITFLKLDRQETANITAIEWFIDSDPGFGQSPNSTIYNDPQAQVSWTATVNTSALTPGMHTLYVRARNGEGRWSITQYSTFAKVEKTVPLNVEALEWFIDSDPGFGKAKPAVPGADIAVNASALSAGTHTLYIRGRNTAGQWSITQDITFIKVEEHIRHGIKGFEWFIDSDPGFGKANHVSISGNEALHEFIFDIGSVGDDIWHALYMRACDENGQWSVTQSIAFKRFEDVSNASEVMALEWFIDDDPGFGNAPAAQQMTFDPAQRQIIQVITVNTSGLSRGLHTFSVRAKNVDGEWSVTQYETFAVVPSRDVTALEWFVDNDLGFGLNTVVPVTPGAAVNTLLNIPVGGLSDGAHSLYIRAKNNAGSWGVSQNYEFIKVSLNETVIPAIARIEYFFDSDPGFGKGNLMELGGSANVVHSFTAQMPPDMQHGIHTLYVRAQDTPGRWSHVQYSQFIRVKTPIVHNTVAMEWFVDTDPGFGNATGMTVPEGTSTGGNINLTGIDPGMHTLYVRHLDASGQWSHTHFVDFLTVRSSEKAADVTSVEYFFDGDPGFGKGSPVPNVTAGDAVAKTFHVALPSGMAQGIHTFYMRARNAEGRWSVTQYSQFVKADQYVAANSAALEWFIDDDPGFGNGVRKTLTPGLSDVQNLPIDIDRVAEGFHTLYIRAQDEHKRWGVTHSIAFVKIGAQQSAIAVAAEWFIDDDPGFGKATRLTVDPAAGFTLPFMVTTQHLSAGAHTLYVRSLDSGGNWSITHGIGLLVLDIKAGETSKVTALEYFIDTDPGFRKATPVNINPASELASRKFPVPTASLPDGLHTLYVRAINENGSWSITQYNTFVKLTSDKRTPDIVRIEYFIDRDPGFGKGKPIPTSPDINITKAFNVDLSDVVTEDDKSNPTYESQHTLYIRALADDGEWAVTHTFDLKISNKPPVDAGDQPQGGAVFPAYTEVCQGRVPVINLRVEGYSKRVGTWESRIVYEDGTVSQWTTVPGSTGQTLLHVSPDVAGSWQYRAAIYDGDRGPEPSLHAVVKVIPAAVGGKATANVPEYLCSGKDFKLTLEEYKGAVVRWQMRNNATGSTWTNINATDAEITVMPAEGGVWEYRAEVAMGECSNEYSASVKVTVISSTTGGHVEPASLTACTGKAFDLTASDYLGKIIEWQYSNDQGTTWNSILPASADAIITVTPAAQGEMYYRTAVKAGNCDITYSQPAVIEVLDKIETAKTIVGSDFVCLPSENMRYSIPAVPGVDYYEWSIPNGASFAGESNRNEVYIDFSKSTVSGSISVKGVSNICGAGGASVLPLEVHARPVIAGNISGPAFVCVGQPATYEIAEIPGVSYTWVLPVGWTKISADSRTVTVIPAGIGGTVRLTVTDAVTGCISAEKTMDVIMGASVNTGPIYRIPNN